MGKRGRGFDLDHHIGSKSEASILEAPDLHHYPLLPHSSAPCLNNLVLQKHFSFLYLSFVLTAQQGIRQKIGPERVSGLLSFTANE
jgi:hypothetical protein